MLPSLNTSNEGLVVNAAESVVSECNDHHDSRAAKSPAEPDLDNPYLTSFSNDPLVISHQSFNGELDLSGASTDLSAVPTSETWSDLLNNGSPGFEVSSPTFTADTMSSADFATPARLSAQRLRDSNCETTKKMAYSFDTSNDHRLQNSSDGRDPFSLQELGLHPSDTTLKHIVSQQADTCAEGIDVAGYLSVSQDVASETSSLADAIFGELEFFQ